MYAIDIKYFLHAIQSNFCFFDNVLSDGFFRRIISICTLNWDKYIKDLKAWYEIN